MLMEQTNPVFMKGEIAHSLPGRLRLRVPGLSLLYGRRREIAQALSQIPGIRKLQLTVPTESVLLFFDPRQDNAQVLDAANLVLARYASDAARAHHAKGSARADEVELSTGQLTGRLVLNGAAALLGNTVLRPSGLGLTGRFLNVPAAASLYLSLPMARNAIGGLLEEKRPNADFLTVTSIVASLLLGNANSALMILALSDMAELMTQYTIEKTRSSIRSMLSVEDGSAWRLDESGKESRVPVSALVRNDRLSVHTGEKIVADGTVLSGTALVDESAITGEFVPVEKHEGDLLYAGTIVRSGSLVSRADKVGDQTVVSRIIEMVEQSQQKKAPIQRYADRFSNYLVPLNFLLFGAVLAVTRSPSRALKMLVIDYSCGIKLSTAAAFSAAINTGVRQGMLIKGGAFLEGMANTTTLLLDKTGTLTEGKPRITRVQVLAPELSEQELLCFAMAAEETSTHPLASAVLAYGASIGAAPSVHGEIVTEVSRGTRTVVEGHTIRVGNLPYMRENGVDMKDCPASQEASIPAYVAWDGLLLGVLYAMDRPRENVRRAMNALRYQGVQDIELLTGDLEAQARLVAEQVGADTYRAQLLPEDKAETVLRLQTHGHSVAMVGDGINDAPALSYADIGISLGSKSTDIAMETSDIVISRDDPMMIPRLRRLSQETMRIVHENFALVIGINSVGLILGASSGISVMMSAVLHNLSTIFVVANSMRLLLFRGGE